MGPLEVSGLHRYARKNPGKATVSVGLWNVIPHHDGKDRTKGRDQVPICLQLGRRIRDLCPGRSRDGSSNATMIVVTPHVKEGSLKFLLLYESEGAAQGQECSNPGEGWVMI